MLIRQVVACIRKWQGTPTKSVEPHEAQLPSQGAPDKVAPGAGGLPTRLVEELFQAGVKANGDCVFSC